MYKAIANLISEGKHFNVGHIYSDKDIKGLSEEFVAGYFVEATKEEIAKAKETAVSNDDGEDDAKDINKMNKEELVAEAEAQGIELTGEETKKDLVALLTK